VEGVSRLKIRGWVLIRDSSKSNVISETADNHECTDEGQRRKRESPPHALFFGVLSAH